MTWIGGLGISVRVAALLVADTVERTCVAPVSLSLSPRALALFPKGEEEHGTNHATHLRVICCKGVSFFVDARNHAGLSQTRADGPVDDLGRGKVSDVFCEICKSRVWEGSGFG
ncbi:hypothetical protein LZ30DRAFT_730739 [Colletotrichum cereale]|nr:hypothetical protein LZ30DRAFT_730739 [Colletotrichum cereale]